MINTRLIIIKVRGLSELNETSYRKIAIGVEILSAVSINSSFRIIDDILILTYRRRILNSNIGDDYQK